MGESRGLKAGVQEKQLIAERVFILILRTVFKVKSYGDFWCMEAG